MLGAEGSFVSGESSSRHAILHASRPFRYARTQVTVGISAYIEYPHNDPDLPNVHHEAEPDPRPRNGSEALPQATPYVGGFGRWQRLEEWTFFVDERDYDAADALLPARLEQRLCMRQFQETIRSKSGKFRYISSHLYMLSLVCENRTPAEFFWSIDTNPRREATVPVQPLPLPDLTSTLQWSLTAATCGLPPTLPGSESRSLGIHMKQGVGDGCRGYGSPSAVAAELRAAIKTGGRFCHASILCRRSGQ